MTVPPDLERSKRMIEKGLHLPLSQVNSRHGEMRPGEILIQFDGSLSVTSGDLQMILIILVALEHLRAQDGMDPSESRMQERIARRQEERLFHEVPSPVQAFRSH